MGKRKAIKEKDKELKETMKDVTKIYENGTSEIDKKFKERGELKKTMHKEMKKHHGILKKTSFASVDDVCDADFTDADTLKAKMKNHSKSRLLRNINDYQTKVKDYNTARKNGNIFLWIRYQVWGAISGILSLVHWPVRTISWLILPTKIQDSGYVGFLLDAPGTWEVPFLHHVMDPIFGPPAFARREFKAKLEGMKAHTISWGDNRGKMARIKKDILEKKSWTPQKYQSWWFPTVTREKKWWNDLYTDMQKDTNEQRTGTFDLIKNLYTPKNGDWTGTWPENDNGGPTCKIPGRVHTRPMDPVNNTWKWFKTKFPHSGDIDPLEDETVTQCERMTGTAINNTVKVLDNFKRKLSGTGMDGVASFEWDEQSTRLTACASKLQSFNIKGAE